MSALALHPSILAISPHAARAAGAWLMHGPALARGGAQRFGAQIPLLGWVVTRGSRRAKAVGRLFSAAKGLRLEKPLGVVVGHLPERTQDWLAETTRVARKPGAGAEESVVSAERVNRSYHKALSLLIGRSGGEDLGDYLEFGVYTGTTLGCMHRALEDLGLDHVRLFGFDSFEGLPEAARTEGGWRPGMYRSSLEETRDHLTRRGVRWDRTTLVKGWFSDTLTDELVVEAGLGKASVIMIDCDIYSSTKTALDFCAELIGDEAIIYFDEFGVASLNGEKGGEEAAFAEFLDAHLGLAAEDLGEDYRYSEDARAFLVSRQQGPTT